MRCLVVERHLEMAQPTKKEKIPTSSISQWQIVQKHVQCTGWVIALGTTLGRVGNYDHGAFIRLAVGQYSIVIY